ncbi:PH domain-containing protein [Idiomarina seosinensis]|uniref:YdbS-like PH domain-containing protein n=1 Tax=Idiomarina seosinensis TaxID=281739 RepID=A0A432ZBR4_9GAMM|nr:PH domain-containing protein [Idiomarina seosinensis]RUO75340.1 hypothetical protein CWI81_10225 [Idiomarina seosinensis]
MAIQLHENEQVQHRAWKSYIIFMELAGFTLLAIFFNLLSSASQSFLSMTLVIVIGFDAIKVTLLYWRTKIAVTNQRLLAKYGAFFNQEVDLKPSDISSFYVQQSFLGRRFNYGTLTVNTKQGDFHSLTHIYKPHELEQAIKDLSNESDQ